MTIEISLFDMEIYKLSNITWLQNVIMKIAGLKSQHGAGEIAQHTDHLMCKHGNLFMIWKPV